MDAVRVKLLLVTVTVPIVAVSVAVVVLLAVSVTLPVHTPLTKLPLLAGDTVTPAVAVLNAAVPVKPMSVLPELSFAAEVNLPGK